MRQDSCCREDWTFQMLPILWTRLLAGEKRGLPEEQGDEQEEEDSKTDRAGLPSSY